MNKSACSQHVYMLVAKSMLVCKSLFCQTNIASDLHLTQKPPVHEPYLLACLGLLTGNSGLKVYPQDRPTLTCAKCIVNQQLVLACYCDQINGCTVSGALQASRKKGIALPCNWMREAGTTSGQHCPKTVALFLFSLFVLQKNTFN